MSIESQLGLGSERALSYAQNKNADSKLEIQEVEKDVMTRYGV